MKSLINKNIGIIIVLLITSRTVYQPYGSTNYLDDIAFDSIRYFFIACLLLYIGYNHNDKTTRKISRITVIFYIVILLEELYFIGKPELHEKTHRTAYWTGNIYILGLFIISFIIDKFTTLFKHGKMASTKLGKWFILYRNRNADS